MKRYNTIANLLSSCAIGAISLGVLSFLVLIFEGAWVIGIGVLFSSLVTGILFLGFAENIHLLQGIYDQNREPESVESDFTYEKEEEPNRNLDSEDEAQIRSFFNERSQKVFEILPTDEPFIYIVNVEGKRKKVEAGGFTLKILE